MISLYSLAVNMYANIHEYYECAKAQAHGQNFTF